MSKAYYLAYYELHELPWKIAAPVAFEARPDGLQFQLGRGPYWIPRMASPDVDVRAGGAQVTTVNESYKLEGGTYFGVAIPFQQQLSKGLGCPEDEWERLAQLADDAASTVGLCLNQRLPLRRVAAYVREDKRKPVRMQFRWQAFGGAPSSISKRSSEAVRRALSGLLNEQATPQTLLALRWYEHSKAAVVGADRFLALWIALEALMGPVRNHGELVSRTARHLALKAFHLGLDAGAIKRALDLEHMRRVRNEIVHGGSRLIPWPVSNDPETRDWPQILDDIVGELLRHRLKATLTRTLNKHVEAGLKGAQPC